MFADVSASFGPDIRKGLNVESAELMLQEKKKLLAGHFKISPWGLYFKGSCSWIS